MKRVCLLIVMAVLAFSSFAIAADEVTWLTLSEGAAKAKAEKKPMIVDFFYGDGCLRCEKLVKGVYDNQAIAQRLMVDFIPIRVDLSKNLTEQEEKLGDKHDYKKECLLLFLDSEGNTLKDPEGNPLSCATTIDADLLIRYLDSVKDSLAGKDNS